MKKRIIIGIFIVLIIILLAPTISAINHKPINENDKADGFIKSYLSKFLEDHPLDTPPSWFYYLYNIIMLSLNVRILILTPLAITPSDEYWGAYDINNYFFFFILFTLVYRFAFWYKLFHKIAERNNWDLYY